ncbi:MAG: hypothetical protein IJS93_02965 [Clostridia bacterium]|nr:hypothetical protein [Clostridia bacterium]
MLKAFLGASLFTASVFVGFSIKKKYKKELAYYGEYYEFLDYAKTRITTSRASVKEIKEGFEPKFISGTFENKNPSYLGKEGEKISSFLASFGKKDYQNTLRGLDEELLRAKSKVEEAKESFEKKGTLAEKLSLLVGVSLVIMVI